MNDCKCRASRAFLVLLLLCHACASDERAAIDRAADASPASVIDADVPITADQAIEWIELWVAAQNRVFARVSECEGFDTVLTVPASDVDCYEDVALQNLEDPILMGFLQCISELSPVAADCMEARPCGDDEICQMKVVECALGIDSPALRRFAECSLVDKRQDRVRLPGSVAL